MSIERKFVRQWKKKGASAVSPAQEVAPHLPRARQTGTAPSTGEVVALPVMAYLMDQVKGRFLRIQHLMFLTTEDPSPVGPLVVDYPITPETLPKVLWMLKSLGWDGRLWPRDPGWPDDDEDFEQICIALGGKDAVAHCMVFIPGEEATATVKVTLPPGTRWFALPDLPDPLGDLGPLPALFAALQVSDFHQTEHVKEQNAIIL